MALEPLADKWKAFGWEVIEVDSYSIIMPQKQYRCYFHILNYNYLQIGLTVYRMNIQHLKK